jgi:membrane fusion protein (multidrug efflux system)|tara:strand:- start:107808 stop:108884 length:1077 start_codon:yes stop_codon:yes gene_type:complete
MAEADPQFPSSAQQRPMADETPGKRGPSRLLIMLSVPLLLLAIGTYLWLMSGKTVSTDNAYVHQNVVSISPDVTGRIVEVSAAENTEVEAGDLLFRIDPDPYRIALAAAEADLATAKVDVGGLQTDIGGTEVKIAAAREDLAFAQDDYQRQSELMDRGFTTRTRFQAAEHGVAVAREKLNAALAARTRAQASLSRGGASTYPAVASALAKVEKARLDLARTSVLAPAAGTVSQADRLQVGQVMVSGVPALSLVVRGESWIEANYKETDLNQIRPGQPAKISIDAYDGLELDGHVASIGAGTGSSFALLPAQNANGNWVKVTQRVPVRLELDSPSPRPLITGLSAHVSVDIEGADHASR